MRYNIWEKDDFFLVGEQRIDMDPMVVELLPELHLTWQFDWDREPCGRVTNINTIDGVISGEIEFFDPNWTDKTMDDLKCRIGGYYIGVEKSPDGSQVLKASLAGASIITRDSAPSTREKLPEEDVE